MNNDRAIEVLNRLLEINNDRLEGYETALNETEDHDIKSLFAQLARTSHWNGKELAAEIVRLGGEPIERAGAGDSTFSVWTDLKTTLPELERETIISACEIIEDRAIEDYQYIIDTELEFLAPNHKELIYAQFALLKDDGDIIHSWREAVSRVDEQMSRRNSSC